MSEENLGTTGNRILAGDRNAYRSKRYSRLELRTKDRDVSVVVLSLINCGGRPGHAKERGPGPCIASKVQREAGPE